MNEQQEIIFKPDPSYAFEKMKPLIKEKKMAVGIVLIIIGFFWYLKNILILPEELFWPAIFVIVGICYLVKAVLMK